MQLVSGFSASPTPTSLPLGHPSLTGGENAGNGQRATGTAEKLRSSFQGTRRVPAY